MKQKPFVWQMLKRAIEALGPATTNVAVRDWVLEQWPGTNRNTIGAQIIVCTVNHPSRVLYPENRKPRKAEAQYDFLFRSGRGQLEAYDPARHGRWEMVEREDGRLIVQEEDAEPLPSASETEAFAAEAHLRDYLAKNLDLVEEGLSLYVDEDSNSGVEFATPVGRIDILAEDGDGRLVVIELKVSKGPDSVVGQVLRYKGWVRKHLADGRPVRGIIIAQRITDRIRYAVAEVEGVELKEYVLSLALQDVAGV